jgi:hypothetical protein
MIQTDISNISNLGKLKGYNKYSNTLFIRTRIKIEGCDERGWFILYGSNGMSGIAG